MKRNIFSKSIRGAGLGFLLILNLILLGLWGRIDYAAAAEGAAEGMCARQADLTDKDVLEAFDVLAEILRLGEDRSPADEENIIRGRGFSAERLNCIFGKIMAGNDIFGWGSPAAYGVTLTEEENKIVKKYPQESRGLKKYLEEELNIKTEKD